MRSNANSYHFGRRGQLLWLKILRYCVDQLVQFFFLQFSHTSDACILTSCDFYVLSRVVVQASYMSMYIHVIESDTCYYWIAVYCSPQYMPHMYMSTCMIPWSFCRYARGKATLCVVKFNRMAGYLKLGLSLLSAKYHIEILVAWQSTSFHACKYDCTINIAFQIFAVSFYL